MIYTLSPGYVPEEKATVPEHYNNSAPVYESFHFMDEKMYSGGAGYGDHTEL